MKKKKKKKRKCFMVRIPEQNCPGHYTDQRGFIMRGSEFGLNSDTALAVGGPNRLFDK